jgi:hypothetical protein
LKNCILAEIRQKYAILPVKIEHASYFETERVRYTLLFMMDVNKFT